MIAQEVADPSATAIWVAIITTFGTFIVAAIGALVAWLSKRSNSREHDQVLDRLDSLSGKFDRHLEWHLEQTDPRDPDNRTRRDDI